MRMLGLVLLLLASSGANAEELSAGQLYAFCTSTDVVATTACRFFILGAVIGIGMGDGAAMGPDRRLRQKSKTHFCIPDDAPQSQMVTVFQDTVRLLMTKYPEDLNSPAVSIIDAAMNRAYPCAR
jgi:Ssp1 endopeptidase immunity protein Rap1a